jgi:hypothetical protein
MRNHKIPGGLWPRIAALAVMAGITLLASGCSGSSSGSPDGSPSAASNAAKTSKAVAYANCMHAHGVNISVNSDGGFSSGGGGGSGSGGSSGQNQSAQNACRHLLPNGGQPSQAAQAQAVKQALNFTHCMRSHGVPNFPDPVAAGNGGISFPNVNANVPGFAKANQACQSQMAGNGP